MAAHYFSVSCLPSGRRSGSVAATSPPLCPKSRIERTKGVIKTHDPSLSIEVLGFRAGVSLLFRLNAQEKLSFRLGVHRCAGVGLSDRGNGLGIDWLWLKPINYILCLHLGIERPTGFCSAFY